MARRPCAEPGCPVITDTTRCPTHTRDRDKARGTSGQRGYDYAHQQARTAALPDAIGKSCHFCGEPILPGQPVALDHTEDRDGYRGITHLACNAADGGRRTPR